MGAPCDAVLQAPLLRDPVKEIDYPRLQRILSPYHQQPLSLDQCLDDL